MARFGLDACFRSRTRVLLITHDPLRANMSGPGVRVLELGRALSRFCEVTVATPFEPEIRDTRCRVAQYSLPDPESIGPLAEQADVIIVQGFTLYRFPLLRRLPAQIVVDLYCPFTIEHLEMRTSAVAHAPGSATALTPEAIHAEATGILDAMNQQLRVGDYFICASERQRDFWARRAADRGADQLAHVRGRPHAARADRRRALRAAGRAAAAEVTSGDEGRDPRHRAGTTR